MTCGRLCAVLTGLVISCSNDYSAQLPQEGRDYLERVRAAAQRMAELIDDLLKLARVTRTPLEPKLTNLSAMAEKIATHP